MPRIISGFLLIAMGLCAHEQSFGQSANGSGIGASVSDQNRIDAIDTSLQSLLSGRPTITGIPTFQSSVTASAFFGDGSHLTGIAAGISTGVLVTASLYGTGQSTAPLGVNSSSVAVLSSGYVLNSQINPTQTSSTTNTSSRGILVNSSVTAGAFFGDASHLAGISCVPGAASGSVLCKGSGNGISATSTNGNINGGVNSSLLNTSPNSVVGGGSGNNINNADHGTIGGGFSNGVSAAGGSIPGGDQNSVSAADGFATGNLCVTAGANSSCMGNTITVNGADSFGGGYGITVPNFGSFCWGDTQGPRTCHGNADSASFYVAGGMFIDTTKTVYITSGSLSVPASSVTASAFFGDGSHLTGTSVSNPGISTGVFHASSLYGTGQSTAPLGVDSSSVAVLSGGSILAYQFNGSTYTAAINVRASSGTNSDIVSMKTLATVTSSVTVTGSAGLLVSGTSVTAGAFFGDGSHLSGINAVWNGGDVANTTTFESSVTMKAKATIQADSVPDITSGGDPSASAQLVLSGKTDLNARFSLGMSTSAGNQFAYMNAEEFGVGFEPLLINPGGGNVGVNTAGLPTAPFESHASGVAQPNTSGTSQSAGLAIRASGQGSGAVLDIGSNAGSDLWLQATNSGNLATNFPILLNPNGGNVGIGGTSTPGGTLDIESGNLCLGGVCNSSWSNAVASVITTTQSFRLSGFAYGTAEQVCLSTLTVTGSSFTIHVNTAMASLTVGNYDAGYLVDGKCPTGWTCDASIGGQTNNRGPCHIQAQTVAATCGLTAHESLSSGSHTFCAWGALTTTALASGDFLDFWIEAK